VLRHDQKNFSGRIGAPHPTLKFGATGEMHSKETVNQLHQLHTRAACPVRTVALQTGVFFFFGGGEFLVKKICTPERRVIVKRIKLKPKLTR